VSPYVAVDLHDPCSSHEPFQTDHHALSHRTLPTLHWFETRVDEAVCLNNASTGLQIEGILAYFTQLKCQKRIGDYVGGLKYLFTILFFCWKWPPDTFYPTYYSRIWLQMP
jgi:hypothetical protein